MNEKEKTQRAFELCWARSKPSLEFLAAAVCLCLCVVQNPTELYCKLKFMKATDPMHMMAIDTISLTGMRARSKNSESSVRMSRQANGTTSAFILACKRVAWLRRYKMYCRVALRHAVQCCVRVSDSSTP